MDKKYDQMNIALEMMEIFSDSSAANWEKLEASDLIDKAVRRHIELGRESKMFDLKHYLTLDELVQVVDHLSDEEILYNIKTFWEAHTTH